MMKKVIIAVLAAAGLLFTGCASSRGDHDGSEVPEDRLQEAVQEAFRLERSLAEYQVNRQEDIYRIFRQRFGEELARNLAEYYWFDPSGQPAGIRATEPLFLPPDELEVLSREDNRRARVLLSYEANTTGPMTWPAHSLEVVLEREESVWKVQEIFSGNGPAFK